MAEKVYHFVPPQDPENGIGEVDRAIADRNGNIIDEIYATVTFVESLNIENGTATNSLQQKESTHGVSYDNPYYPQPSDYAIAATGEDSVMLGGNSMTKGRHAVAMGRNTLAQGANSLTYGNKNVAIGNNSLAGGTQSFASGDNGAVALGSKCQATGSNAFAQNASTLASGGASHAEGGSTKAEGLYSHAGGRSSQVTPAAEGGFAHGWQLYVNQPYQTAFGKWNEVDPDAIFNVGNGTSADNRSSAFKVNADGSAEIAVMGNTDLSVATKKYVDDLIDSIDLSDYVTLNTAQTITGAKTFTADVSIAGTSSGQSPELKLQNNVNTTRIRANGYATDINTHLNPRNTDTYTLGTSQLKWKDLYLNGNLNIGSGKLWYNGSLYVNDDLSPSNNSISLGKSAAPWGNIYLSGNINLGNEAELKCGTQNIFKFYDQNYQFVYQYVPILPYYDGTINIGSSSTRWKDLYLSGNINLGASGSTTYITSDTYGGIALYTNGAVRLIERDATTYINNNLYPLSDGTRDIGTDQGGRFRDVYISGKLDLGTKTAGGTATSRLELDQYDGVGIFAHGVKAMNIYDNAIYFIKNMLPNSTNAIDIGNASHVVRTVYANAISDGTNSVSVADLAALIAYAKTQGWIS